MAIIMAKNSKTGQYSVMIVEDDPRARRAVHALLKSHGHIVHSFENAEDAAEALATFSPDIAVLDVRLPGMFGNDLACLVKERSPNTRIIFLTAEREFHCQLADYTVLPKPLDPPRLLHHFNNKRREDLN